MTRPNRAVTALVVAACASLTVPALASAQTVSNAVRSKDLAALSSDAQHLASLTSHIKPASLPSAKLLASIRTAEATLAAAETKVNADEAKPKPKATTTTTTTTTLPPSTTTTTTTPSPTVVSQSTATGDNADATIDPVAYYLGPEELVVQASPPQVGVLTWDITCDESGGGTADSGAQQATIEFPATQALTLPTQNASGGCSIFADAQLNGAGTVTIQWVVTGHEVSSF